MSVKLKVRSEWESAPYTVLLLPWNDFKVILGTVPEFFITNKLIISTRGAALIV